MVLLPLANAVASYSLKLTVVDEDESVICSDEPKFAGPVASVRVTFQMAPFVPPFGAPVVTADKATVVGAPEVATVNDVTVVLAVKTAFDRATSSATVSYAAVRFVVASRIVYEPDASGVKFKFNVIELTESPVADASVAPRAQLLTPDVVPSVDTVPEVTDGSIFVPYDPEPLAALEK